MMDRANPSRSMPVPLSVPAIVAEAPRSPSTSFIVGQDPQGHWVAVETHGLGGGLFRTRHDALHYAIDLTGHRPDAVVIATDRIELRI
ncbi:hypothetical protein [Methylobacterium sp. E-045]|uniref:hypothetical protein n=1 Tax=Methylobacterium sp. E-045 TaxID=2836575 RepID=UPI001FB97942|nr:hypothetical protein [Methylobacterium sp. E-045]MCJ2127275.1 hypothetical protein [Methylobacterium sp. E-045]